MAPHVNRTDLTKGDNSERYLQVINDFTNSLLYVNTEEEILWTIATKAVGKLDLEDCVVYLLDKEKGLCVQMAAHGPKSPNSEEIIRNSISIPLGKGIVGSVAKSGKAEIVNDTLSDPRYIVDDYERNSEIAVPIIINGEVIGVIDSENAEKDFYTDEHLNILTTIASIASTKLAQARALRNFQQANNELERIISETTNELKRSNEELKRYAYTVSHDLKAPLRLIAGHIEILKKKLSEEVKNDNQEILDIISGNANNMHELVEGVLEHSLLQKNRVILEEVDTSEIVSDLVNRIYIPDNIRLEIPKNLPIVQAKRLMLSQVFQNLLTNAIRYNDKDKGVIQVRAEDINEQWLFSVKDNGIGIDPRDHEKVFQLFTRAKNNQRKDATGIGLATVKKIIESYKGKIWLSSELGKGTTIYFTLPKE